MSTVLAAVDEGQDAGGWVMRSAARRLLRVARSVAFVSLGRLKGLVLEVDVGGGVGRRASHWDRRSWGRPGGEAADDDSGGIVAGTSASEDVGTGVGLGGSR